MNKKHLTFDNTLALYVIEEDPELIVLGVKTPGRFSWVNGDFEDVENPDTLEDILKNAAGYIEIEDEEDVQALVVNPGRLMVHVGYYPGNPNAVFAAIRQMIQRYFQE